MPTASIILCSPQSPGNIGSISRAMANFGFAKLVLVNPPPGWRDDEELKIMANGYVKALDNAQVITTLDKLLPAVNGLIGFTRRSGAKRPILGTLENAVDHICQAAPKSNIGLVFGNERTGLTQGEIDCCDSLYTIETTSDSGSLNLSLAASLVMYELARGLNSIDVYANDLDNQPAALADGQAVEQVTAALLSCLQQAGLHDPARQHRSKADERLRRIIMRSRMSEEEAKWLQRTIENLLPFVRHTP